MAESKAITDWKKCVALTKLRNGISKNTYIVLRGKLLKEAQTCYCAMGY